MFRVFENDVKTFQTGKCFYRSRLRVGVTDRANSAFVIGKLRRVAAGARHVAGKFRRRRIIFSLMAKRAGKTRMRRI